MTLQRTPEIMLGRGLSVLAAILLTLILSSESCRAQTTFNWPLAPAWAATGPTSGNSETVDYYAAGTGFGVSVTVLNSGVTWQAGYPQTAGTSGNDNGGGTTSNSLQLFNSKEASTSSYVKVTINLNYVGGVTNPTFQLWDIDASAGQFKDTIANLQAVTTTGAIIYPTLTPTSGYNQVTGSGSSTVISGTANAANNTNQGTVGVSFTGIVTSISFQWSNGDSGVGAQSIAISPITFTPVGAAFPEVGSGTAALALCGCLLGAGRFRRRMDAGATTGA